MSETGTLETITDNQANVSWRAHTEVPNRIEELVPAGHTLVVTTPSAAERQWVADWLSVFMPAGALRFDSGTPSVIVTPTDRFPGNISLSHASGVRVLYVVTTDHWSHHHGELHQSVRSVSARELLSGADHVPDWILELL